MPFEPTVLKQVDHAVVIARAAGAAFVPPHNRGAANEATDGALFDGMKLAAARCGPVSSLNSNQTPCGKAGLYGRTVKAMNSDSEAWQPAPFAAGGCIVDREARPLHYATPRLDNATFLASIAPTPV